MHTPLYGKLWLRIVIASLEAGLPLHLTNDNLDIFALVGHIKFGTGVCHNINLHQQFVF